MEGEEEKQKQCALGGNRGSKQSGFLDARIPMGRKCLPTYPPSSSSALG